MGIFSSPLFALLQYDMALSVVMATLFGSTYLKMYWNRPSQFNINMKKKQVVFKSFFYSYDFSHILLSPSLGMSVFFLASKGKYAALSSFIHTHPLLWSEIQRARKTISITARVWRTLGKMQMIMTKNCRLPLSKSFDLCWRPIATATDKFFVRCVSLSDIHFNCVSTNFSDVWLALATFPQYFSLSWDNRFEFALIEWFFFYIWIDRQIITQYTLIETFHYCSIRDWVLLHSWKWFKSFSVPIEQWSLFSFNDLVNKLLFFLFNIGTYWFYFLQMATIHPKYLRTDILHASTTQIIRKHTKCWLNRTKPKYNTIDSVYKKFWSQEFSICTYISLAINGSKEIYSQ